MNAGTGAVAGSKADAVPVGCADNVFPPVAWGANGGDIVAGGSSSKLNKSLIGSCGGGGCAGDCMNGDCAGAV